MRIATWNIAPTQLLVSNLSPAMLGEAVEVRQGTPHQCTLWLQHDEVDVALLPTWRILQQPGAYKVIPGIGFASTQSYPFAQLQVRTALNQIQTVGCDPEYVQEILISQILLAEHYELSVQFVPHEASALAAATEDALLRTGPDAYQPRPDALNLDLSREWFEMTSFPMVWGLFAIRPGHLTSEQVRVLSAALRAHASPSKRKQWLQNMDPSDPLCVFLRDHMLIHIDPLVEAGLDALVYHLYMRGALDDMPAIPFALVPQSNADPSLNEVIR